MSVFSNPTLSSGIDPPDALNAALPVDVSSDDLDLAIAGLAREPRAMASNPNCTIRLV